MALRSREKINKFSTEIDPEKLKFRKETGHFIY